MLIGSFLQDNNEAKGTSLLDSASTHSFELQTAPISDGVLTGVIRQLVVEYVPTHFESSYYCFCFIFYFHFQILGCSFFS